MKLEVRISKNNIFVLIAIILILASIFVVYAYNSALSGGTPSIVGHSPDEIMVSVNGVQKSLQAAINNNDFKRPSIAPCSTNQIRVGGNCVSLPTTSCFSNQVLTYSSGSFKCILNTA